MVGAADERLTGIDADLGTPENHNKIIEVRRSTYLSHDYDYITDSIEIFFQLTTWEHI